MLPGRQVDIPKLKRGGVDCIWLSEGAPGEFTVDPMAVLQAGEHPSTQMFRRTFFEGAAGVQRLLRGFDAVRRLCTQSDDLELVTSTEGIRVGGGRGKIAVLLAHRESADGRGPGDAAGLSRAWPAGDGAGARGTADLDRLRRGAARAEWPDRVWPRGGSRAEPAGHLDGRVARVGTAIDHVLDESSDPIVASHSNAKAISGLQRNLTDDHIKRIADGGASWGFTARPLSWILPANMAAGGAGNRCLGARAGAEAACRRPVGRDRSLCRRGRRSAGGQSRSTRDFQRWGWTRWWTWWITW